VGGQRTNFGEAAPSSTRLHVCACCPPCCRLPSSASILDELHSRCGSSLTIYSRHLSAWPYLASTWRWGADWKNSPLNDCSWARDVSGHVCCYLRHFLSAPVSVTWHQWVPVGTRKLFSSRPSAVNNNVTNIFSRSYCNSVWSDIGIILPSVRLSATLCIVALRVGVGDWKLYHRVHRTALPIHFFRHVCCIVQHGVKANRRKFRVWNSHGERGHVTMAIPDAAFSAVRFCSYTERRKKAKPYKPRASTVLSQIRKHAICTSDITVCVL